jgi:hypothetical protein
MAQCKRVRFYLAFAYLYAIVGPIVVEWVQTYEQRVKIVSQREDVNFLVESPVYILLGGSPLFDVENREIKLASFWY